MNTPIVLTFAATLSLMAAPTVAVSIPPDLKAYLGVLSYGTPEYESALDAIAPGLASSGIAPLLPYSVIVRNVSSQFLRGYNVSFWVQGAVGAKPLPHSFISLELDGTKPGLIPPGGTRFISILPAANHAVQRNGVADFTALPPTMSSVASMASDLSGSLSVQLTVEAIVTNSGALIGPDRLGLFNRIQGEQRADASLAAALKTTSSIPATLTLLENFSKATIDPSPNPFARDFYSDRLARTASLLLAVIKAGNQKESANFVDRVTRTIAVSRQ